MKRRIHLLLTALIFTLALIGQTSSHLLNPIEKTKAELTLKETPSLILRSATENTDYTQGVFFVNEDWYGHQNSTINYLTQGGEWVYRVFQKENPGHELGCTSQYGAIYGGKFYVVSKQEKDPGAKIVGSRFAVVDAKTMKVEKEFPFIAENKGSSIADGRAFLGVDEKTGYIGSSNGIWLYDMEKQTIGEQITGTGNPNSSGYGNLYYAQIGTMIRVADRVFAVHQQYGLIVIDALTHKVDTTLLKPENNSGNGLGSIVMSKDGFLWASVTKDLTGNGVAMTYLWKINPYTLNTEKINIPVEEGIEAIPNSWYAWTADGFCASKKENKIYWNGYGTGSWFTGYKIFCYDIDTNRFSLLYDFTKMEGSWRLYGTGFRIHPVTDEFYCFLYHQFQDPTYKTVRISNRGELLAEYPMSTNYWFPAIPVFPDNEAPVVSSQFPTAITLDEHQQEYKLNLGGIVSDADNMDAGIIKTITSLSDSTIIKAEIQNDTLYVQPLLLDAAEEKISDISLKFNSNGRVITKTIKVTLKDLKLIFKIDKDTVSVYEGKTSQLKTNAQEGSQVEWKSDDETIATVSNTGLVTAIKAGQAHIIAENKTKNVTDTCTVNVIPYVAATNVSIDNTEIKLQPDSTLQLTATVGPSDASPVGLIWESSNKKYFTVDETGLITGIAEGAATVTVSMADNPAIKATKNVTVVIYPDSISFTDSIIGVQIPSSGYTTTLPGKVSYFPRKPKSPQLTWELSDGVNIKSINASTGRIDFSDKTKEAYGIVKVTTTNQKGEQLSTTTKLIVTNWITSISLEDKFHYLSIDDTVRLKSNIVWNKADPATKKIKYLSSNPEVATVDEEGLVKALKKGRSTILVYPEDGSNKKDSCAIIVDGIPVENIDLTYDTIRGDIDTEVRVIAKVYPENATFKGIKWTYNANSRYQKCSLVNDTTLSVLFTEYSGTTYGQIIAASEIGEQADTVYAYTNPMPLINLFIDTDEFTYDLIEDATVYNDNNRRLWNNLHFLPEKTSYQNVEWTSSDPTVFTFKFPAVGGLQPIGTGTAVAYVKSTQVAGQMDSCIINITNKSLGVTDLTLNTKKLYLEEGEFAQLTATVVVAEGKEGVDTGVEWVSSDPEIAIVDNQGNVVARKIGSTLIRAITKTGHLVANCEVGVVQKLIKVTGVKLDKASFRLVVGGSSQLTATVSPANASNQKVSWMSSNTTVATVNENGTVIAVGAGSTTISATTADEGYTASCMVYVENPSVPVEGVSLNNDQIELKVGDNYALLAFITPENATNRNVSWESSDPSVASVASGLIRALGVGSVTITVTTEDGYRQATCLVTVQAKEDPKEPTLDPAGTEAVLTFYKTEGATSYELSLYKYAGQTPLLQRMYITDSDGNTISVVKSGLLSSSTQKIVFLLKELEISATYIVKVTAIKEVDGNREILSSAFTKTIYIPVSNENLGGTDKQIFYKENALYLKNMEGYRCHVVNLNGSILAVWDINGPDEKQRLNLSSGIYIVIGIRENDKITQKISVY